MMDNFGISPLPALPAIAAAECATTSSSNGVLSQSMSVSVSMNMNMSGGGGGASGMQHMPASMNMNNMNMNMNMNMNGAAAAGTNLGETTESSVVPYNNNTNSSNSNSNNAGGSESRQEKTKGRRGRKPRQVGRIIKNPDWLPDGWITEIKIRDGGISHGGIDRFFYDPVSNHRFRSKREVLNFLETGRLRHQVLKQKKEALNGKALEKPQITAGSKARVPMLPQPRQNFSGTQNATGCRSITPTLSLSQQTHNAAQRPVFSSENRAHNGAEVVNNRKPRKVRWVLVASEGSWEPHIGDDDSNGTTQKEVESAIDLNCNSTDGCNQDKYYTPVLKDISPEGPKNESTEGEIDLNIARQGSSVVSPIRESWPDPFGETIPVSPYFF